MLCLTVGRLTSSISLKSSGGSRVAVDSSPFPCDNLGLKAISLRLKVNSSLQKMEMQMNSLALRFMTAACAACAAGVAIGAFAQQVADPDFDAKVAKPAYTKNHPKVLFDGYQGC